MWLPPNSPPPPPPRNHHATATKPQFRAVSASLEAKLRDYHATLPHPSEMALCARAWRASYLATLVLSHARPPQLVATLEQALYRLDADGGGSKRQAPHAPPAVALVFADAMRAVEARADELIRASVGARTQRLKLSAAGRGACADAEPAGEGGEGGEGGEAEGGAAGRRVGAPSLARPEGWLEKLPSAWLERSIRSALACSIEAELAGSSLAGSSLAGSSLGADLGADLGSEMGDLSARGGGEWRRRWVSLRPGELAWSHDDSGRDERRLGLSATTVASVFADGTLRVTCDERTLVLRLAAEVSDPTGRTKRPPPPPLPLPLPSPSPQGARRRPSHTA